MSRWKENTYFRETHSWNSQLKQTSLRLVAPDACPAFSKSNYSVKWEAKARTLLKLSLFPVVVWPLVLRRPLIFVPRSSGYMDWFSLLSSWIQLCFASYCLGFAFSVGNLYSEEGRPKKGQGRSSGFCTFQVAFAVFSVLWSLQILRWVSRARAQSMRFSKAKGRRDGDSTDKKGII